MWEAVLEGTEVRTMNQWLVENWKYYVCGVRGGEDFKINASKAGIKSSLDIVYSVSFIGVTNFLF